MSNELPNPSKFGSVVEDSSQSPEDYLARIEAMEDGEVQHELIMLAGAGNLAVTVRAMLMQGEPVTVESISYIIASIENSVLTTESILKKRGLMDKNYSIVNKPSMN